MSIIVFSNLSHYITILYFINVLSSCKIIMW
nr:MAG TPA: hypothetical protein [Caudoviricetes sp.]